MIGGDLVFKALMVLSWVMNVYTFYLRVELNRKIMMEES